MALILLELRFLTRKRFFFFNDTATTEIYALSLHDALPIYQEKNGLNCLFATDQGNPILLVHLLMGKPLKHNK